MIELDTSYFVGNAPGWAAVSGVDRRTSDAVELLPRQRLQPDTLHRFRVVPEREVTHVRVDVYPDGGMARVRLWGELSCAGREDLALRWYNALPDTQLGVLLGGAGGGAPARPARRVADVPDVVRAALET